MTTYTTSIRRARHRVGERATATDMSVFLAVAGVALALRVPFLDAGYGAIRDAWRVASAGRLIAETGDYWASRFPPHPVQELVSAVMWRGGPLALNLTTALISSAGIGFFALAARRLRYKYWIAATAAVAMTPQIYIASITTIDYMWALSFVLAALYAVVRGRPLAAGVLMGLAIGCRMTSAAMLLPLSLVLVYESDPRDRLRRLTALWLPACALGAALYAPAIGRYGADTLTFAEYYPYDVVAVAKRATLDVWGAVGAAAIGLALLYQSSRVLRVRRLPPLARPVVYPAAWLVAVALFVLSYLRLPHLAAYLIPTIPFVVLLLHDVLERRTFLAVSAALVVSPFVGLGPSGLESGALADDRQKRIHLEQNARAFVSAGNALPGRNVVVTGHWRAPVDVFVLEHPDASTRFVYLLTAQEARAARRQGHAIYHLPGGRELNLRRHGFDLSTYGSKPLDAERSPQTGGTG